MCLMRFSVTVVHILGKQLIVAHTVSYIDQDVRAYIEAVVTIKPISPDKLDNIRKAMRNDSRWSSPVSEMAGWDGWLSFRPSMHSMPGLDKMFANQPEISSLISAKCTSQFDRVDGAECSRVGTWGDLLFLLLLVLYFVFVILLQETHFCFHSGFTKSS